MTRCNEPQTHRVKPRARPIVVGALIVLGFGVAIEYRAAMAALAASIAAVPVAAAFQHDDEIKTFRIDIPDEALVDLRRRLLTTRWPDKETVSDQSQGIQLETLQALVRYWGTSYDWRKIEANLNGLPQFVTRIDGVDIHFIHVRSRHANALPVIITHGWPGSVIEQLKIIGPLTDPTAHGGTAADAFHVVIPSLPGYGYSSRPTATGWDPDRIARAWAELMNRLGYKDYVAQGGDWGTPVSSAMARQAVSGLRGIHINLPATVPTDVAMALGSGIAPAGLTDCQFPPYSAPHVAGHRGPGVSTRLGATRLRVIGGHPVSPQGGPGVSA